MGRLVRDPETRYTNSAEPIAIVRYTLAVNRQFKREGQPDADFIDCTVFGKSGEFAQKYFKKGQMVAVTGRLQISSYEKDGQKRWSTDVMVEEQHFAESRQSFESRMANGGQSDGYSPPPPVSQGQAAPSPRPPASGKSKPEDTGYFPDPEGFMPVEESVDDDELPF